MHSTLLGLPASCSLPHPTTAAAPALPPPWLQLKAASKMFTPIKGELGAQGVRFVCFKGTNNFERGQSGGASDDVGPAEAGLEAAAGRADQLMLGR